MKSLNFNTLRFRTKIDEHFSPFIFRDTLRSRHIVGSFAAKVMHIVKVETFRDDDNCNAMATKCCVTISKRILAVSGSRVTESRSPCKGYIVD